MSLILLNWISYIQIKLNNINKKYINLEKNINKLKPENVLICIFFEGVCVNLTSVKLKLYTKTIGITLFTIIIL